MKILVTGGAGFIGSHLCVSLLEKEFEVIVVDNLDNSNQKSLDRVADITGKKAEFYNFDLRDTKKLSELFENNEIEAVIHMAGMKAVGESVELPLNYYEK